MFHRMATQYDLSGATRFEATACPNGIIGCLQSHTRAMHHGMMQDRDAAVWICEDDIRFTQSPAELQAMVAAFLESDADMLMIENHVLRGRPYDSDFIRVDEAHNLGSYIIKPRMRDALMRLYDQTYEDFVWRRVNPYRELYLNMGNVFACGVGYYAADQIFKVLLPQFLVVAHRSRRTAKQLPSFSDIGMCFNKHDNDKETVYARAWPHGLNYGAKN